VTCPRCGRAIAPTLASCPGCGAPLALGDEPAPRALDVSLSLDRRGPDRTPPPLPASPAASAPPAVRAAPAAPPVAPRNIASDRSHWDLGRPLPLPPAGPAPGAPRAPAAVDVPLPDVPEPEVTGVEVHLRRAPSGRRALAWAIDLVPLLAGALFLVRTLVAEAAGAAAPRAVGLDGLVDLLVREAGIVAPVAALLVVVLFVYGTLAHALAGATLGKWIARIRVAGPDGLRPSLGRSAARSALAVVSAALVGLGIVAALFTRSGRALHDLGASTWVVEAS
jgi:resuscitation-promoting factor RpfA